MTSRKFGDLSRSNVKNLSPLNIFISEEKKNVFENLEGLEVLASIKFLGFQGEGGKDPPNHHNKLRRLGFPNQIVNDLDSKPSKFNLRL